MISDHRVAALPARRQSTNPVALAVIETVALLGALVWAYVAVVAMVYPERLNVPLASWLPVRRDALATLTFAVSIVAFFVGQCRRHAMSLAGGRTVFVYSAMISVYLMGNSISHPTTMDLPLTHLVSWPLERTVLCGSLICLVSSFFALRVSNHRACGTESTTSRHRPSSRTHDFED